MTSSNPKCILISGGSRMGKSTFADRLIREFPDRSFHYLSYDALKDMLVDCGVFDRDTLKISAIGDKASGYRILPPDEFVEASIHRDKLIAPFIHTWTKSEMSRGHDVIVNHAIMPQTTHLYTAENCIPLVFLALRDPEEQAEHFKAIRNRDDVAFNWMRLFDDDQLVEYARSSLARNETIAELLSELGVPFFDFGDFDADLGAMHDAAFAYVQSSLGVVP